MSLDKSKAKKILIISLTNIGDVILTLPTVDVIRNDFPDAEVSLVVGPKVETLFVNNPHFKNVYVFDKHQSIGKKWKWVLGLRKEKFDFVVDLRNTAIPLLVGAKYRTSLIDQKKDNQHMKQKHLDRLKTVYDFSNESPKRYGIAVDEDSTSDDKMVVIAPGAAHPAKRWDPKKYAQLVDLLIEKFGVSVVLVGSKQDQEAANELIKRTRNRVSDMCDKLNLQELAQLMQQSILVCANDSGPMHLASYLNRPCIAFFGMGSPLKYGPWSSESHIFTDMNEVNPEDVMKVIKVNDKGVTLA